ncbi:MAG: MBOAT family O-acyltransferase [Flavobacteriales bacterium]
MLPYSDIPFFIIAIIMVAAAYGCKSWLHRVVSYRVFILSIGLCYTIFFFPKPWHLLLYVCYAYGIYYLFPFVLKWRNKLAGVILTLLPMLIVKSEWALRWHNEKIYTLISFAGLSYMCFKMMSVHMDAHASKPRADFLNYVSYLLFTPVLLIGPIDRLPRFEKDLQNGYANLNAQLFRSGWESVVLGLLYKFVLAEIVSRYWLPELEGRHGLHYAAADVYAYLLYLFFDFAGYSHLAIGLGKMLGINVPVNFNKPFLSVNPQDFWQRWHKSLGDWLRDYFFMPLYKFLSERKMLKAWPLLRQNVALFCTFLLMGCWNGFEKHYILSGAIFGLYSVVHNTYVVQCKKQKRDVMFGNLAPQTVKYISIFIMINLVAIAVYVFSGRSLPL